MNPTNTTGLILAGGAGRRVGGQDKGLVNWQGKPLAAQVAERLRPQVGRLLISCNRHSEYYATLADATVSDSRADFQGPLAGLEAAHSLVDNEFLIISACDTPRLPLDLAQRLLRALTHSGKDISYAHDGERHHYLCAAIRSAILPSIPDYLDKGERAVRHWYAEHRTCPVDFSDQPQCFRNYNQAG